MCDVDEEILGEQLPLFAILSQDLKITRTVLDRGHRHAPLDATLQRAWLVEPEIVRGRRTQKIDDLGQAVLVGRRGGLRMSLTYIWRQNWMIASGIFATGRTRSARPVSIALRGMPS